MASFPRALTALFLLSSVACVDTRSPGDPTPAELPPPKPISDGVLVDFADPLAEVPPFGFGMHTSVYDNALHEPTTPAALNQAGITMLRYPGGGYADNYHWSVHRLSPFHSSGELSSGYLADRSDFPNYMLGLVESSGAAVMITVNYGSNLQSAPVRAQNAPIVEAEDGGPGEPKEAAAWVAYANGDADDETVIGEDSTGVDWKTVGYWASLRASAPVAGNDPENFLRIEHPEPFGIVYWEIGNEVFGNGYHGQNYEEDLHVPYGEAPFDFRGRSGHPDLSGSTYGAGVVDYAREMKAVDPNIKIGAVLNSPPIDNWGQDWNSDVLRECGSVIDFGIVHFYPGQDPRGMLAASRRDLPLVTQSLRESFAELGGDNPERIEITMTEVGSPPGLDWSRYPSVERHSLGLFALDVYLTAFENGFSNVDWLELHNGTFLSERAATVRGPAYYGTELAFLLAKPGDTLFRATSTLDPIAVHAAEQASGRRGIVLANTHARGTGVAIVTVTVEGAELPTYGERYDFVPGETTPGELTGPEPFDGFENPFTIELQPYQATLLLFGDAG
jgi:hypothetical protein